MNFNLKNLLIVFTAFLVSFIATFIVKKIAVHVNAIDVPDERKIHKNPTPRLGGLAIFVAFIVGYMLFGTISTQMISILIGGFIIVLTGVVDDIKPVPAKVKFLFQILAAATVVVYGKLYFNDISLFGTTFQFPVYVNMILSIIFIIGIVNAINFIDGLDGLSSGISSIYFLTIAVIAIMLNRLGGLDVTLALIMLGSTLGFLEHNFPPAKIFIGDTGSMFLGFMISVTALLGYKVATITSLIIPILLLFIPILDTLLAIIRRILKHEAIDKPDKEHLHHQLLRLTASQTKTVLIIYAINIVFSAITVLYVLKDNTLAMILYILVAIVLIIIIFKTDVLFKHKK